MSKPIQSVTGGQPAVRASSEHERALVVVLRVLGCVDVLALVAVVVPRAWMAKGHAWAGLGDLPAMPVLDSQLHAERLNTDGSQRRFETNLDDLPDGVFVTRREPVERAYLIWKDRLLVWSPGGYGDQLPRPSGEQVVVLTPRSTVEVIRVGYIPAVHCSAGQP